jgi:hypothetical protein
VRKSRPRRETSRGDEIFRPGRIAESVGKVQPA